MIPGADAYLSNSQSVEIGPVGLGITGDNAFHHPLELTIQKLTESHPNQYQSSAANTFSSGNNAISITILYQKTSLLPRYNTNNRGTRGQQHP